MVELRELPIVVRCAVVLELLFRGLDPGEAVAQGLGLQSPNRPLIDKEQVVGVAKALRQPELSDGDATASTQVDLVTALDDPPSLG